MGQVILIGPICAGKSTLLPLVADRLGRPYVDLDDVADPYYEEVGRGRDTLNKVGGALGDLGAYRWWQHGHPHAVRRVLEDHPDAVVALGAGHTTYEDVDLFDTVRALLKGHVPVLVLPSPDLDRSVQLLRERCVSERDMDWIVEGVDFIEEWVKGPQNHDIARITVFTEERTADEVADQIVARLRGGQ